MALKHKGEHVDLTFPNQNLNYSFFHLNATTGGTWTLVYSVKVLTPHPDCRTSLIGKRKQTHCQVHLKGNVIAAWITLNEQYLKVFCRTYEDMWNRFKACMTKINLPRTDKSLSRFHFSGSWVFTGIISLHPHWYTFCSVWCLKTSLEICFTVGWKCHISPPDVLSLSLLSSHSPCLIRSVISPHSGWCLLIWHRYCLPVRCCCLYCLLSHLTNSSKKKRKRTGENSCKSCGFAQLTVQVWLGESLSSSGARNVCLLV